METVLGTLNDGRLLRASGIKAGVDLVSAGDLRKLPTGNDIFNIVEPVRGPPFRDLHHDCRTELAVLQRHRIHDRPTRRVVLLQGLFRGGCDGKREGEHAGVDDRLTAGLRPDRPHGMSRIPEQRHPAKTPTRQWVAIFLWVFVIASVRQMRSANLIHSKFQSSKWWKKRSLDTLRSQCAALV